MNTEQVQTVISELRRANDAAFRLLEESMISRVDGDEWKRFPSSRGRCPISNYSRSQIYRLAEAGKVRTKHVGRARFYSGNDLRKILAA